MPERAHTPPGYNSKANSTSRPPASKRSGRVVARNSCAPTRPVFPHTKGPLPRPDRPAAPPRQKPGRAAEGRAEEAAASLRVCFRRPNRGPSPPRLPPSVVFERLSRRFLSSVSAPRPTAVARPRHKGRGGGGATGRRPGKPPLPGRRETLTIPPTGRALPRVPSSAQHGPPTGRQGQPPRPGRACGWLS